MLRKFFHPLFAQWVHDRRQKRLAKTLALRVLPELREDMLRKRSRCSDAALVDYSRTRAAQLVHPLVDDLLKADSTLDAAAANELIVIASAQASQLALSSRRRLAA